MSIYQVEGGRTLEGTARVHGAKNSVLPILAASVLCPGVSVVHNCPDLSDVRASIAILEHLGCRVERSGDTVTVDAAALTRNDVPDALMREMRYLDKLVDELAKGKAMEAVLRQNAR